MRYRKSPSLRSGSAFVHVLPLFRGGVQYSHAKRAHSGCAEGSPVPYRKPNQIGIDRGLLCLSIARTFGLTNGRADGLTRHAHALPEWGSR